MSTTACEYGGHARRQDAFEYMIGFLANNVKKRPSKEEYMQSPYKSSEESTFKKLYDNNWENNLNKYRALFQDDEEEKTDGEVEVLTPPDTNNDSNAANDENVQPDSPVADSTEDSEEKPTTPQERGEAK